MKERRALVVGIDYYKQQSKLHGCVNDAQSVMDVLELDEYPPLNNFECIALLAKEKASAVSQVDLSAAVEQLFEFEGEAALFYFAGHGYVNATGGFLAASDTGKANNGLPLSNVLTLAAKSKARNKIIVLDSCQSGAAGADALLPTVSSISEGTTILTASTAEQYASEKNGSGVFTKLFVDALRGGAADLVGRITLGSVYAHIDQSLGNWEQRPVFKTNVKSFFSLRHVLPKIPVDELRQITKLFKTDHDKFQLNPTYEPQMKGRDLGMPAPIEENTAKFAILQKYNRNGLVVPVDAPHMWDAAMKSKSCELTALGRHYHRLVAERRI